MENRGNLDLVLGLQRGDEGKGRIIDLLAKDYDIVARFNGGHNAGHKIVLPDETLLALRLVPSGIAYPEKLNIIGNGVLLEPVKLLEEIAALKEAGINVSPDNLVVSDKAALNLPHHAELDNLRELGSDKQGSTKRGIAFAAADKYERIGAKAEVLAGSPKDLRGFVLEGIVKVRELRRYYSVSGKFRAYVEHWLSEAPKIAPYLQDTVSLINEELESGSRVLAEGAQAFWLDIEHGPTPYTTSSHTTTGGALNGLGVSPHYLDKLYGVGKLVNSHVGDGHLVTEVEDEVLAAIVRGQRGEVDSEHGTVSGRERAVGYPDLVQMRQAIRVNGINALALNKLDHLTRFGDSVKIATAYELEGKTIHYPPSTLSRLVQCIPVYEEFPLWKGDIYNARTKGDLPGQAIKIVNFIQDQLGVRVELIGVGYKRDQIVDLR